MFHAVYKSAWLRVSDMSNLVFVAMLLWWLIGATESLVQPREWLTWPCSDESRQFRHSCHIISSYLHRKTTWVLVRFRASNWASRITAMFYTMTGCFPSEKFPSVLSVPFPAKRCVHPPANGNRSYWNAWKIRHCRKDKDWHKERLCASPLKIIFKNETNNNNNIFQEEK